MLNTDAHKNMALKTDGRLVVNAAGEPLKLTGVNCAGLEWAADGDRIKERAALAFDDWKANIIRLPVSQDRWFGHGPDQEDDRDGARYRALCDEIIDMATGRDKYIDFDLHWSNTGKWGGKIGQHCMPDALSVGFWHDAAARYANHPAVLFGLYNEPYGVSWDEWQTGGYNEKEDFAVVGMQTLINTIRARGAKNVLVIGGLDWGFDLRGVESHPLDDRGGDGIIYDSHIYPWKPAAYDDFIPPSLAAKYPILIGECGHYRDDANNPEGRQRTPHTEWNPELLAYIRDRGFHVTAWDFHPSAGPCLIKDFAGTPTEFWGEIYKGFCAGENGR